MATVYFYQQYRQARKKGWSIMLFTILLTTHHSPLTAQVSQRLSYTPYTITEGLASNLVKDMAFDANGFLWVSTVIGLQRFDGKTFHTIPKRDDAHGIHYDKEVNLLPLKNGELLITTDKGVAFYDPNTNRFRNFQFSFLKNKSPDQLAILPLKEEANTAWLMESTRIFQLDAKSGKILFEMSSPVVDRELMAHAKVVNENNVFVLLNRSNILMIDTKQKTARSVYETPDAALDNFHVLHPDTLLLTTHRGMQKINIRTREIISFCPFPDGQQIADFSLTTSLQATSSVFLVGVNNHLWEYDVRRNIFSRLLTDHQGHPFFTANLYSTIIADKYNNIWAGSYIEGIRKIRYSALAIKYYGVAERERNFAKCIYTDKKNDLVLVGMLNTGLQVFDTNGRLLKNINQFEKTIHQPTITAIEKINNGEYLLFMNNKGHAYIFNRHSLQIKKAPPDFFPFYMIGFGYYFNVIRKGDSSLLLKFRDNVYQSDKTKGNLITRSLFQLRDFETSYLFEYSKENIWLAGKGKYVIYDVEAKTFSSFTIYDDVLIKCMTKDKTHFVWMATEKGLYKVDKDGKIIRQYTSKDGLPDEGIYAVITDNNGNLWFSHNKGISRINPDSSFFTMDKEDGLQENEFNTNSIFKTEDGELFFGGVNGVSSFYPDRLEISNAYPQLFVTDIKVKEKDWHADTSFWNIKKVVFPYNQNALAISFNALGPENTEQYNYQYRMTGVDEQWINAGSNRTARYVLNPGEYRFLISAGIGFNENAKPLREMKVIIRPAWWQTWWFRTMMGIFTTGLLVFGIISYNRRKLRKKLQEIQFQQQLQKERERISRDLHDNIGAYTSALMANADKLPAGENGNISEAVRVKENAKQILSSLRETIWVLNSKEISVTDFADGFKQYANKMLENYPEVQIQFEEIIETNKILSPTRALNLYRILQEALQNTLKYAKAKRIDFYIRSNEKISMQLQDDGSGFDPGEKGFGNGLNNMEYRAAEAGFSFVIQSEDKKGTAIKLSEH